MLDFFLYFSSEIVLVPFFILGFFFINKKIFSQVITIFFMGCIFNTALKVTFKVPLASFLKKEGFSFPSGHIQSATTVYVWSLFLRNSFFIKALIVVLLSFISIAIMSKGYHNIFEILGGFSAAALVLFLYNKIYNNKYCNLILFVIASALIIYINYMFKIQDYVMFCYFGFMGFVVSDYYLNDQRELPLFLRIIACILCLIIFPVLYYQNNIFLYFVLGGSLHFVNYLLGVCFDT